VTMPKHVETVVHRAQRSIVRGKIDTDLVEQLISLIEWQWKTESEVLRQHRERILELERLLAPGDRCDRLERRIPQRLEQGSMVDQ